MNSENDQIETSALLVLVLQGVQSFVFASQSFVPIAPVIVPMNYAKLLEKFIKLNFKR